MMKKLLPKIVFLLLVFIVGCRGGYQAASLELYRGTSGLEMNFMENVPPDEVFERAILPVGIEIRNEGLHDIVNGYITFSLEEDYMLLDKTSLRTNIRGKKEFEDRFDWIGAERVDWEGNKPRIRISLAGKNIENVEGEYEIITLKAEARELEELSQVHESSILATACYGYKTDTAANVCVDTDIYNLKGIVKSCKVKDLSLSSQGAPVAVTGIETDIMPMDIPNKVRLLFLIYIENKGDGIVIKKDDGVISDACSEKPLDYSNFGIVFINATLGGEEKQLNCDLTDKTESKGGIVKLKDNEGIARCVLEEGVDESEGTYPSLLRIELNYGYTHTVSKEVIIKKPAKY